MNFINPKTDFAFKKIFGSIDSKNILISFLNALLYDGQPIIEDLEIIGPYSAPNIPNLNVANLSLEELEDLEKQQMLLEDQRGAILKGIEEGL